MMVLNVILSIPMLILIVADATIPFAIRSKMFTLVGLLFAGMYGGCASGQVVKIFCQLSRSEPSLRKSESISGFLHWHPETKPLSSSDHNGGRKSVTY
jgi:hypothetical protein